MNIKELILKIAELDTLPAPYEKGDPMWCDPYISTHMLTAHLDESSDIASYRPERRKKVVEAIIEHTKLKAGDHLLDLGCGPGLYAELFASRGIQYTGIDFSTQSLGYAMAHSAPYEDMLTYRQLDYTQLDYEDCFDAVSMIWCDFGALSPEDRDATLSGIHRALKKDGTFVFDVMTDQAPVRMEAGARWEAKEGGFWHPDHHILLERMVHYEAQMLWLFQAIVASENGAKRYRVWDKRYDHKELTEVLEQAGFDVLVMEDMGLSGEQAGFFKVVAQKH